MGSLHCRGKQREREFRNDAFLWKLRFVMVYTASQVKEKASINYSPNSAVKSSVQPYRRLCCETSGQTLDGADGLQKKSSVFSHLFSTLLLNCILTQALTLFKQHTICTQQFFPCISWWGTKKEEREYPVDFITALCIRRLWANVNC